MKRIMVAATLALTFAIGGSAAAQTQTLKMFSKAQYSRILTQKGKSVQSGKPQPGWVTESFGTDFAGTQANHTPTPVGFDSFFCVVYKWPLGDCQGEVGYQGSVVSTTVTHMNLEVKEPSTITFKVSYADGVFAHVKSVTSTALPHHGEEFSIPGATAAE